MTTVAIPDTRRNDIIDRVRHACMTEGRQAYWVCTLIEESELLEAQAAEFPGTLDYAEQQRWLEHRRQVFTQIFLY